MSRRSARWLASGMLLAAVAAVLGGVLIGILHGFHQEWGGLQVVFAAFGLVGWRVATRRPRNPVGWLLLVFGCLPLVLSPVQAYAELALEVRPGSLPAGDIAAWVGELPWLSIWSLFGLALLLFPSGRPVAPAWRWPLRVLVVIAVTSPVVSAVALWPVRRALYGAGSSDPQGLLGLVMTAMSITMSVGIVAGVVSIVVRYRSAGPAERAQLRWIAWAGGLVVIGLAGVMLRNVTDQQNPLLGAFGTIGMASLPVAMGIAMLRYRLYDVDRLASRTVTYALLTGLLGGAYGLATVLLARLLAPLGAGNDLVVAGATLTAAALFAPGRRRIQTLVDRRFDRERYDAEHEVQQFRERLRGELDLDEIAGALVDGARRTVQPVAVTCWLRDEAAGR